MFKKTIASISFIGLLLCGLSIEDYIMRTYTKEVTVIRCEQDITFVEDNKEEQWSFIGNEYKVGESLCLVMDNNHTDFDFKDDTIINVKRMEKE